MAIKNEDKEKSLSELSNVYSYIPKFLKNCCDDSVKKTIISAKEQVLKAYSILDAENWDDISSNIQNAIDTYSKLLTDASLKANNQYEINKAYIQINELKNTVDLKDKDIFLIKYKNLLEELDNM